MSRLALLPLVPVLLLLASLAPAIAEKPMSSPAQLASQATHVVRGEVVRVYPRVSREGMFRRTDYVAEVKVKAVEKGEGIRLDRPLYARYWSRTWTGPGYPPPGTNGHSPLPEEGEAVRVYLARNAYDGFGTEAHDGGYDVIGVNGWKSLTPADVRAAEAAAGPQRVQPFPVSWQGVWTGELTIAKPGEVTNATTRMVLAIRPTDDPARFEFRLRYGEQDWRRYELVVRDVEVGRYALDEQNGVVLPVTYLDGELFSYFSVDGSLLLARYRLDGDFLRFDLTTTGLEPSLRREGGGRPPVGGHRVQVVQRALLRR